MGSGMGCQLLKEYLLKVRHVIIVIGDIVGINYYLS